ncbi:hypothetical protein AMTRI_Chr13g88220 [Amborella trichopoda]
MQGKNHSYEYLCLEEELNRATVLCHIQRKHKQPTFEGPTRHATVTVNFDCYRPNSQSYNVPCYPKRHGERMVYESKRSAHKRMSVHCVFIFFYKQFLLETTTKS